MDECQILHFPQCQITSINKPFLFTLKGTPLQYSNSFKLKRIITSNQGLGRNVDKKKDPPP